MNLKRVRKYRKTLNNTSGLFKDNPVIVLAMALPFIIVPTVNLKSAVIISIFIFAVTITCAVLASFVKDKVKAVYAIPFYCSVAMVIVTLLRLKLKTETVIIEELGVYIWLTAINSIMIKISATEPRENWLKAFKDAFMMCMGFAVACCFVGAIREILGNRTIWDKPFEIYSVGISGVVMPFFGFILIGFVSALFRSVDRTVIKGLMAVPSFETQKKEVKESAGDKL